MSRLVRSLGFGVGPGHLSPMPQEASTTRVSGADPGPRRSLRVGVVHVVDVVSGHLR